MIWVALVAVLALPGAPSAGGVSIVHRFYDSGPPPEGCEWDADGCNYCCDGMCTLMGCTARVVEHELCSFDAQGRYSRGSYTADMSCTDYWQAVSEMGAAALACWSADHCSRPTRPEGKP